MRWRDKKNLVWDQHNGESIGYVDIGNIDLDYATFSKVIKDALPANIYIFKFNNRNTIKKCEICLKWRIKTPEQRQWRCSGVIIINFEHISHLVLVSLLLTLNK